MARLTVEVSAETEAQLRDLAERLKLPVEEMLGRQLATIARASAIKWPGISFGADGKQLTFSREEMYAEREEMYGESD